MRIEGAGGAVASEFVHGPDRARVKQTLFEGATAVKAITYLGAFERHAVPGQADELVHYIAAGGTVAIYTKVDDGSPATDRMRYLHRDHLGSVDLVTDGAGLVAEARSFDPWGRARNADWAPAPGELPLTETKRGFTGHEHLDSVGLIHMNGRVYDPAIGRMLSADPIVQTPTATQSHNRYTYVMNNPLSFTDPSGFEFGTNAERGYGDDGYDDGRGYSSRGGGFETAEEIQFQLEIMETYRTLEPAVEFVGGVVTVVHNEYRELALAFAEDPASAEELAKEWEKLKSPLDNLQDAINAAETGAVVAVVLSSFRELFPKKASPKKATRTYQAYTKSNPKTGQVYSGRTSGYGTPLQNVARRDRNHHMNEKGFGPVQFDKSSSDSEDIRGRE